MPEYHIFQICNRTFYISYSLEYIWLFVTWNVINQPFVEWTRKFRTHMWTSDLSCGRSSFTNIPFPVIAFRYLIERHSYLNVPLVFFFVSFRILFLKCYINKMTDWKQGSKFRILINAYFPAPAFALKVVWGTSILCRTIYRNMQ